MASLASRASSRSSSSAVEKDASSSASSTVADNSDATGYKLCDVLSWLVWPAIVALPLTLTAAGPSHYSQVFPIDWYDAAPIDYWSRKGGWPLPLGLTLGILAVIVGQAFMLVYFCLRRAGALGALTSVQREGARPYELSEGLTTHLAQPEGFVMLGGYLVGTWMLGLMPASYYSFSGGIDWKHVLLQLLLQDLVQYCMHMAEHKVPPITTAHTSSLLTTLPCPQTYAAIYQMSHKPHHRFTNPRLFDAFNGSPTDTFLMILVPLAVTARLVPANVWSYMAFGSLYANWLTLIHR